MSEQIERADMLVLPMVGRPYWARREPGQRLLEAIRLVIPGTVGTQGMGGPHDFARASGLAGGPLRLWFCDDFAGQERNYCANNVVPFLVTDRTADGWFGPVVVTPEEDPDTEQVEAFAVGEMAAIEHILGADPVTWVEPLGAHFSR